MTTSEAREQLELKGLKVGTMHVNVGNIYQCEELDGWHWMYERIFLIKAKEYLK